MTVNPFVVTPTAASPEEEDSIGDAGGMVW